MSSALEYSQAEKAKETITVEFQNRKFEAVRDLKNSIDLPSLLDRVVKFVKYLGVEFSSEHNKLISLQERLSEGRFHLAVLGQFKRGKSTLLNALLGESLLPTSVVPLTAIPTFIRSGQNKFMMTKLAELQNMLRRVNG